MILKPDRKLWVPSRSVVMPRSWFRQRGFFAPAAMFPSRKVGAADFDGTNDYMLRGGGLTGAVTTATGIFSVWLRVDGGNLTRRRFLNGLFSTGFIAGPRFSLDTANKFQFTLTEGTATISVTANTANAVSSVWVHYLVAWDTTAADSGAKVRIYRNDVDDTPSSMTYTAGNTAWDAASIVDWAIGVERTDTGANKWNGCLAELYLAIDEYLDLDIEANRRKFITADGKPAPRGEQGQNPTGTPPLVYLRLRKDEAVANFAVNRGTGGNFSITGALDYASSSPSD